MALFLNFNFPKRIYLKGDSYVVSRFLDFLNKNGVRYKIVNFNEAKYVIDFDNLKIDLYNGMSLKLKWKQEYLEKCLENFDFYNPSGCSLLKNDNKIYLPNVYFYDHFTIFLSCGINIIVVPSTLEALENFVYRTFSEVINGKYDKFENEYLVTDMYVYMVKYEPKLIGIYDPKLSVMTIMSNENIQ